MSLYLESQCIAMTFRIDRIHFTEADASKWLLRCWFKGFMGTAEHASAEHVHGTKVLTIRSCRVNSETVEVEGFDIEFAAPPQVVRQALAEKLEGLGWGPEVDAFGRPKRR